MDDTQKDYLTVRHVSAFMEQLGIVRGFSIDSINRKLAKGQFPKPHLKSSNTRYWTKHDITDWVDDGMPKVA